MVILCFIDISKAFSNCSFCGMILTILDRWAIICFAVLMSTSFFSVFFASAFAVSFMARSSVVHPSFMWFSIFCQFSSFVRYLISADESMTFTVFPH